MTDLLLETLPYKANSFNAKTSWAQCVALLLEALDVAPVSACMEPLIHARLSSASHGPRMSENTNSQPLRLQDAISDAFKLKANGFNLEVCNTDLTTYIKKSTPHIFVSAGTYETAVSNSTGAKALPQKVFMNSRFAFVVCPEAAAGDYLIQLDMQGYYLVARPDGNGYNIIGHALSIESQDGLHIYRNIHKEKPQIKAVFDARDLLVLVCLQKHAATPEHVSGL